MRAACFRFMSRSLHLQYGICVKYAVCSMSCRKERGDDGSYMPPFGEALMPRIHAGAQLWGPRGKILWDGAGEMSVRRFYWLVHSFKHNDDKTFNGDTVSAQSTPSMHLRGSVTVPFP